MPQIRKPDIEKQTATMWNRYHSATIAPLGALSRSGSRLNQVRCITLNDDAGLSDYAQHIVNELCASMVRVEADFSATARATKRATGAWPSRESVDGSPRFHGDSR